MLRTPSAALGECRSVGVPNTHRFLQLYLVDSDFEQFVLELLIQHEPVTALHFLTLHVHVHWQQHNQHTIADRITSFRPDPACLSNEDTPYSPNYTEVCTTLPLRRGHPLQRTIGVVLTCLLHYQDSRGACSVHDTVGSLLATAQQEIWHTCTLCHIYKVLVPVDHMLPW